MFDVHNSEDKKLLDKMVTDAYNKLDGNTQDCLPLSLIYSMGMLKLMMAFSDYYSQAYQDRALQEFWSDSINDGVYEDGDSSSETY